MMQLSITCKRTGKRHMSPWGVPASLRVLVPQLNWPVASPDGTVCYRSQLSFKVVKDSLKEKADTGQTPRIFLVGCWVKNVAGEDTGKLSTDCVLGGSRVGANWSHGCTCVCVRACDEGVYRHHRYSCVSFRWLMLLVKALGKSLPQLWAQGLVLAGRWGMVVGRGRGSGTGVGTLLQVPGLWIQLFFREASLVLRTAPVPCEPCCFLFHPRRPVAFRFQFTFVTWEGQWLS